MAASVADAMSPPELQGVKANTDLESERKRSDFERLFASDETEEQFEIGKLSEDANIYYKSLAAKIQAYEVNSVMEVVK